MRQVNLAQKKNRGYSPVDENIGVLNARNAF